MKNNKILSRLFAVLATLLLVVAMALPCFADGVVSEETYCLRYIDFGTDGTSFLNFITENYPLISQAAIGIPAFDTVIMCNVYYDDTTSHVSFNAEYTMQLDDTDGEMIMAKVAAIAYLDEANYPLSTSFSQVLYIGGSVDYEGLLVSTLPIDETNFTFGLYYYDLFVSSDDGDIIEEQGWYGQIKNIIKDAVFGSDTVLNDSQEFTLNQIALWLSLIVILLPLIVGAVILVRCFR